MVGKFHFGLILAVFWMPFAVPKQFAPGAIGDKKPELSPLVVIKEGLETPTILAISPDSKVLAAGNKKDGRIGFWDLRSGKLQKQSLAHPADPSVERTVIKFSPDGSTLATLRTGKNNGIRLWNWRTGAELARLNETWFPGDMAFGVDGKTLAVVDAHHVKLFDVGKNEIISKLPFADGSFDSFLALSPNGKMVAANGFASPRVRIFDFMQEKEIKVIDAEAITTSLHWTKKGDGVITFGFGLPISFWSLETGIRYRSFATIEAGGMNAMPRLALPADESLVAVGMRNGNIKVVEIATAKHMVIANQGLPVFSPDGALMATVGVSSGRLVVNVWEVVALRKALK